MNNKTNRNLNIYLIFIILSLALVITSCSQPMKDSERSRPNIILIVADDQGWGDLSINGNQYLSTPNIDKLANSGATFDRFYVSPVCSPTRAELLTGRYHVRGGVYSTSAGGERLDLDETTFADIFKQNGYKTAAYGKWHNGMQYPYHPNARGFDDFYGFCSGHWGNYYSPVLEHNGELVKGNGFIIDDLTDKALEFVTANKDNPFLLYLPYNTPHSPMQVPDEWWNKFKDKTLGNTHRYRSRENIEHTKAAYAMVENIDWNVARLMEKIEELGLDENTIVIYMSDNGPNGWRWNGGMEGVKGSTSEGGVRSPFFIRWAGMIEPGKKIETISGAIDLLPTLTDMAGIESSTSKILDGRSLKPLILTERANWQDRYMFSHWGNRTSVRSQQYRLDHEDKLFDMGADPGQAKDIAEQQPDQYRAMILAKQQWEQEVLSELPTEDLRVFPVGHPNYTYTQLPARDGIAHGGIKRSNRWPNCSFYTNWTSTEDSITWDVEVLESGSYEAVIYYSCSQENVGSTIQLSLGKQAIESEITQSHDRVLRIESYVKDFIPANLGVIQLEQGAGTLTIKALGIPGGEAIDFRLIMLKRV